MIDLKIGISCYPTIGGSGAVATELGKALANRGHQVHFIVTDVPFRLGEFHQNIFIHEVDTASYPVLRNPPYDLSLAAFMADVITEFKLDILHVHYALPFAVCAFLAKEMLGNHPVKTVTTLHGTDVTVLAQDKSLQKVIRLGIEKSDAVTAVSESLIRETRELFQTTRYIDCVYNFIDTDVFHPAAGEHMRSCLIESDEKILLHVSNFRKVKRVTDVIEIFARVHQVINSKLLLVGEGPELQTARNLVRELDLSNSVLFLGKQDEVASLFATSDVFLLPSEKESFGLVALEAMACGVPTIGSTIGGIPEVVVHGETGYLAPVTDVEKMAAYAIQLLTDDALYQRVSWAARERAKSVFHVDTKVAEYEAIYQRLLDGEELMDD